MHTSDSYTSHIYIRYTTPVNQILVYRQRIRVYMAMVYLPVPHTFQTNENCGHQITLAATTAIRK